MARFLIFLLSVFHVCAVTLIISKPGSDVSINCPCVKVQGCNGDYMGWTRLDINGTVEEIDTDCQKPPCRFYSQKLNDFEIQLTISLAEKCDSGRYYCGDKSSTLIVFKDGGTRLHVGEEDVWTKNSKIRLLFERFNDSLGDQHTNPRHYTELRCLVTGLGAPVSDIFWQLSGGRNRTGQILESVETKNGFQVMSQLQIPVPISHQLYYNNSNKDQDTNSYYYSSHDALQNEYSDKELEEGEWWCEVHAADNKVYKSNTFSFKKNREESVSVWCTALFYAAIAFSTVCVILLLLILISHWMCNLHTDHTNKGRVLPLSGYQVDIYTTVKYIIQDFKCMDIYSGQRDSDTDKQTVWFSPQ